ncbi:MAG: UDP-3-O-(3-hydroxymyristoyl)glucosamine N-acyltransferase [Prolixibacteraceae bacterium]|nr:UDP-3-O-(3-hydroxymyristoyl)glucosamine N-acyltransferase [Prolixibacteraceae bacterium]
MEFKATDIADFLQGEIVGDGDVKISNISKIEEGKPGSLAFLANKKYEHFIYNTAASVVLVNKSFIPKQPVGSTLIKVENAYEAFASLLDFYVQSKSKQKTGIEQPSFIDKTVTIGDEVYVGAFAYIGENSQIGNGVKIFPQVHIGNNVTIGNNCILYAGTKIYDDCRVGDRCIIHAGAVIGADGFGFAPQKNGSYKKIHQIGNVIIEEDVEIGANTTVDCGTIGSTIIRRGVKLDNLIQVAHNCEIGEHTVIAAQTGLAGTTKLGKNCKIGGQVGMAGHLTIGDNVAIGAQSGVSKSVKSNETLLLTPAIDIKTAIKSSIIFKNLPQLCEEVTQLKKEVETQRKNKKK